jgi:hypothetical protein
MRLRLTIFLALMLLGGGGRALWGQFTPAELAERPKWEEFLATAAIVGQEQLSGPDAVTNPWKLTLQKDGIKRQALWKNAQGMMNGFLEGWTYEVAAYRLDKFLGLNMVPPTVERRFKGDRGSCQLWIEDVTSLRELEKEKERVPADGIGAWDRAIYLERAFDNLIANQDRNQGEFLITRDWRVILIDHSRAFRTSKRFTTSLIFSEKSPGGPQLMKELPRAFVEKLKALDHGMIRAAVGEYLTDKEIQAMLTRKPLILQEIDKLIARQGESNVLYE